MIEGYLSIKQVAEMWNLNPRTVRNMCANGRINGAVKFGRDWMIPKDVKKPVDGRVTSGKYKNWRKGVE